jgi:hypothetical protein
MKKKWEKYLLWAAVGVGALALYEYWWKPLQNTNAVNASIAAKNSIATTG